MPPSESCSALFDEFFGDRPYGVDMTERIGTVAVREEDLVERAAAGDIDAFEALVAARPLQVE